MAMTGSPTLMFGAASQAKAVCTGKRPHCIPAKDYKDSKGRDHLDALRQRQRRQDLCRQARRCQHRDHTDVREEPVDADVRPQHRVCLHLQDSLHVRLVMAYARTPWPFGPSLVFLWFVFPARRPSAMSVLLDTMSEEELAESVELYSILDLVRVPG